jgi:hypothetical protein
MSVIRFLSMVVLLVGLVSPAAAQQPAATPLTLEQMEAIYQRELSARHIPLISRYMLDMQRQQAGNTDSKLYLDEVAQLMILLKANGVVDLHDARTALQNGATSLPVAVNAAPAAGPLPPAASSAPPAQHFRAALALGVPTATESTLIGRLEWRAASLPAGEYDVRLEYSAAALTQPLTLAVQAGTTSLSAALPAARATPDEKTFRFFKIGRIKLESPVRGGTVVLTAEDSTTPPRLIARQLIFIPVPAPGAAP